MKNPTKEQLLQETFDKCCALLESCWLQNPQKKVRIRLELSSRMSRTLGKTVYSRWNPDRKSLAEARIVLQEGLCDPRYRNDLEHVLLHELIHVMYPKDQHGPAFQACAKLIQAHYPHIDITRLYDANEHDYKPARREKTVRYRVMCPSCQHVWEYERMSNSVRHPEEYRCGKCKKPLVRIQ